MIEEGKTLREIDKPIYRYWQALYHSFYDGRLYIDVAKRWKGLSLSYLLLVIALFSLPFSIRVILEYNKFFNETVIEPLMKLPTLYMQNGQVSINHPSPYFVKNNKGDVVSIVDTSGSITSMESTYPDLTILVTKDKLLFRNPTPHFFFSKEKTKEVGNVAVYPFNGQGNSIFEGKDWVHSSGVLNLQRVFGFLIYPTIVFAGFAVFLVLILTVGLMGQFIAKLFFDVSITYLQSCRLLIVAMTPFMLIFWLIITMRDFYQGTLLFLPIIVFIYFCFAVVAVKRESRKLVS